MRTVDISKDGSLFAHHVHIESAAREIFNKLAEEKFLRGLNPAEFSDRAAYYLSELNALHPFRDGNGRTQREFMSHVAQANGYYIAWENMNRMDILQASIASFLGDILKLTALVRVSLQPLDREN